MMNYDWLDLARKIQSIAQAGLTYTENPYDKNRYEQLQQLAADILHHYTDVEMDKIINLITTEKGYLTPKVDVRGVIFRDDRILMVRERIDDCWSVPGGWADVGLTPFEVAEKEVWEETGLTVKASRLLAVLDKKCYAHPPDLYHIYKLFILCNEKGGKLSGGLETSETGFFQMDNLPPLSTNRITKEQIRLLFEYRQNPAKETLCD
ncbi:MAG: NUDIX hydrolase [Bacteroidales bacterium]|nr:NUDIX hydrolase [Bacteroidales bacterium]MBN2763182.1 NUDIX hydrolase [Bacteroidales bacterium]